MLIWDAKGIALLELIKVKKELENQPHLRYH
jgi:hypothetical protein